MQWTRSQLKRKNQRGYVLLAILFALTLLIIGLAAAAPSVATALKRTKEDELVRRGQQYSLAIRRFYKKFGRYPSDIDQLESTNNIRFLRRRYLDPLTGKDDWKPIQFGQARPSLGFFGEKVTTIGGASPAGPGLGPSTIGTGSGGTSDSNSSNPSTPGASTPGSTAPGAPGAGASGGQGSSPAGPAGSASNPLSTDQLSGKTFGGGAIVGVSVPSQKESLKEFQQKNHYNEWQFVYDPTMDPTTRGALGTAGAGGVGVPGIGGTNPGGLNPQQPGGLNPAQPGSLNPSPNSGPGMGSTNPNPH
jgi:type II secretory pathway pseudopilin PulG